MTLRRAVAPGLLATAMLAVAIAPTVRTHPPTAAPSQHQHEDTAGQHGILFNPELAAVSCPVERGPVKEGSDADRFTVSTTVTGTTVAYLVSRSKPTTYPKNHRLAPYERKTWQLSATLLQYKQESDGDLHLVIQDSGRRKMIAEIPYLPCVPASSRWRSQISSARARFTRLYPASTSWHYVHRAITINGLGMFDPPHGQTGAATNGIELHPVTAVGFR